MRTWRAMEKQRRETRSAEKKKQMRRALGLTLTRFHGHSASALFGRVDFTRLIQKQFHLRWSNWSPPNDRLRGFVYGDDATVGKEGARSPALLPARVISPFYLPLTAVYCYFELFAETLSGLVALSHAKVEPVRPFSIGLLFRRASLLVFKEKCLPSIVFYHCECICCAFEKAVRSVNQDWNIITHQRWEQDYLGNWLKMLQISTNIKGTTVSWD